MTTTTSSTDLSGSPVSPAARRTFGALQRMLALLNGRLREDGTLRLDTWLAAAADAEDLALRRRAWTERTGPG